MSAPSMRNEQDLLNIAAKDSNLYVDVSLAALTMYSLYWLHQWQLRRTIEAVSILNWRLFPERFSMVGFPQFPDAFRTNRSLLQGQPKYRNWLTGAASAGYNLNEQGLQLVRDLIITLGPPQTTSGEPLATSQTPDISRKEAKSSRTLTPEQEVSRVRATTLFEKWKASALTERDLIHVHSLLRIFDHTPATVRRRKMKDLERDSEDARDEEVTRFLADVRSAFPAVFQDRH